MALYKGITRFIFTAIVLFFSLRPSCSQQSDRSPGPSHLPDSVVHLEEVRVEAYQPGGRLHTVPGSLSLLIGEDLTRSGGTHLAVVLNTLPGVQMQSGTYATNRIVIRGMGSRTPYNSNRIRAYLNDIPLTTSEGVSTPEEIDLNSLGRIELIKGPASALYGSGLGGSINLYTPAASQNKMEAGAQYGSFSTGKTHWTGTLRRDKSVHSGTLTHLWSDGYRENNHFQRSSFLSGSEWKSTGWSLSTLLLLIGTDAGIPSSLGSTLFETSPQSAASNWKAIEGHKAYRKAITGITLNNILSERITNRLTVFGKWNDNYEKRPFNNLDDQSASAGIRNRLNFHTDKTDWVAGMEWTTEQYAWQIDKDGLLLNKNRENRIHLNIFTMLYYRPFRKLNLSAAVAVNRISYRLTDLYPADGDQSGTRKFPFIFSPRLGVNFAPNDLLAVYASAGHGFSLPSPEEALLPEGNVNPEILPEQGFQDEAGTRLNLFSGRFSLDGSFYLIELNNLLVTKRVTEDIFMGINAGRTRHLGFELQMNKQLFDQSTFPGKLSSVLSYTRSLNRFIDFTDDGISYDGNHLPGIPGQMLRWQVSWNPAGRLELMSHVQYTGGQYLDDGNSLLYPGFLVINLKVNTAFPVRKSGTVRIYAGFNNLTDTHYASMVVVNAIGFAGSEPRYYYPGLPRHGYAGMQVSF